MFTTQLNEKYYSNNTNTYKILYKSDDNLLKLFQKQLSVLAMVMQLAMKRTLYKLNLILNYDFQVSKVSPSVTLVLCLPYSG